MVCAVGVLLSWRLLWWLIDAVVCLARLVVVDRSACFLVVFFSPVYFWFGLGVDFVCVVGFLQCGLLAHSPPPGIHGVPAFLAPGFGTYYLFFLFCLLFFCVVFVRGVFLFYFCAYICRLDLLFVLFGPIAFVFFF